MCHIKPSQYLVQSLGPHKYAMEYFAQTTCTFAYRRESPLKTLKIHWLSAYLDIIYIDQVLAPTMSLWVYLCMDFH